MNASNQFTATASEAAGLVLIESARALTPEEFRAIRAAGFAWQADARAFVAPLSAESADFAGRLAGCLKIESEGGQWRNQDAGAAQASGEAGEGMASGEDPAPRAIVNHYEARQAARRERLAAMADKMRTASAMHYSASRRAVEHIPLGQPILAGHHSERGHRATLARAHRAMDRSCEAASKAEHYAQRAASVGNGGISSDDPAALVKLRAELAQVEALQENMKAVNKAIRTNKTPEAQAAALVALGMTEADAAQALKPDFMGRVGFHDYRLKNNGANARRIAARIAEIEARRQGDDLEHTGNGYTYREDVDENRVMFEFPAKPDEAVRDILKGAGFRWSPSRGAWVRQLNAAGRWHGQDAARQIDAINPPPQLETGTHSGEDREPQASGEEFAVGSVRLAAFTAKSRARVRVWGVRVLENGQQINAADGSGAWFKHDTRAHMIEDLERAHSAAMKYGDPATNENRWRENFGLPPITATPSGEDKTAPAGTLPDGVALLPYLADAIDAQAGRDSTAADEAGAAPPSGEQIDPTGSGECAGQVRMVEQRGRDGRAWLALAGSHGYALTYGALGVASARVAKLRAAGVAATLRGLGPYMIEVDPSGEVVAEACPTLLPGRWIPGGAERAERIAFDAATGGEVWLIPSTSRPGALAVIAYSGKRTKHDAHYTMRDRAQAEQWAGEYIGKLQAAAQRRAERRAEQAAKRATGHKLQPGDVLRCSWGYDQTNIDYYEVTRLIGRRMVEIRKIGAQSVDSGNMTGECVPRPGHYIGEPLRKAVSDYDGQSVRIASYASAHKIEPREVAGVKVWPVDHWTAYA